jgi:proline-specific peptidase
MKKIQLLFVIGTAACILLSACNPVAKKLVPGEGYLHLKGGKVWYRIVGTGEKTPLLLLHGGPGVPSYYLNPIAALGKDRPVIFFDQLGCGRSDRISDTALMTIDNYVEEVKDLRDSLGLKDYYIYGQSWGTILGTDFCLAHPEGIRALILSSSALSIKKWMEDAQKQIATLPDSLQQMIKVNEENKTYNSDDYQKALKVYYEKYVARKLPWSADIDSALNPALMGTNVYMYMEGPSEFTITGTLKTYDRTPDLGKLKLPVLYIVGDNDEANPETTKYYQSLTPGARLAIIQNAGHLTMQDNALQHNQVLSAFLDSCDKK